MSQSPSITFEEIHRRYADLLFDLCYTVLQNEQHAKSNLKNILAQALRLLNTPKTFKEWERASVFKIAFQELKASGNKGAQSLSSSEQLMLDAASESAQRLARLESYLQRLPLKERILLLLKDKYGLPWNEISVVFEQNESSLKTSRQQALRALEDGIWGVPT